MAGCMAAMADVTAGKTPNAGLKQTVDEFPSTSSTLAADFARVELRARPFESRDLEQTREMFRWGMHVYLDKMPKGSPLYSMLSDYVENALNTDLKDAESLLATYAGSGGGFWVVVTPENDDEILGQVGFQKLESDGTKDTIGELRRMAVGPKAAHKGIGAKLVRTIEEHAAANGFSKIVLTTGSFMDSAVSFYTRTGFEVCRFGHPPPEQRAQLEAAGQELYEVAYRKPVTSNNGRWMWQPHGP